jgi:hypothetical protein
MGKTLSKSHESLAFMINLGVDWLRAKWFKTWTEIGNEIWIRRKIFGGGVDMELSG